MKSKLTEDARGAVFAELVIAIVPFLLLSLGILQLMELYAAKMAVDHAAMNAARSAVTVFADDPRFYGGEAANREGPRRTAAVKLAAVRAMAPFVLDGSVRSSNITFPSGVPAKRGETLSVELRATYVCRVPLVHDIVCWSGGTRRLVGRASMPSMAADYLY